MLRIKELRINKSMAEVARDLGIPYTTYVSYEKGEREPDSNMLKKLANYYHVSVDFLVGQSEVRQQPLPASNLEIPRWKRVPEIGDIAAGSPILAEQNFVGDVECPDDIDCDYALRVKGDSMIDDEIYDGDIVYIRQQPAVDNGQIAAVIIDGEATLKRYYMHRAPDGDVTVTLQPANKAYAPFVYRNAECENIIICGLAVGVFHRLG